MRRRVAPFGDPRIYGYLLLPEAFRSLSRPSSAPDAKAFPLRSFQLDRRRVKRRSLRFRRKPFGLTRRKLRIALLPLLFHQKTAFFDDGDGGYVFPDQSENLGSL